MRLLSCHIENFGNISGADYAFDGALTEFCRENGYGKTTLASFIKAMFYGLPISRKGSKFNDRQHFYPFGGGKFGGNLVFEMKGREYKIERFFDRSSVTKDSLRVYCNGNETEEFGMEPGKSIFGLDAESFERTIFLTPEGMEISATSDISAKLNHYVDNTDEDNNFDTAIAALEKAGRTLRASRGKNDLISRQQAKIHALESEIENLTAVSGELDRKYSRREALTEEIDRLRAKEKEAGRIRAVLQKWEVYDTYLHSLAEEKERLARVRKQYPGGLLGQEEIKNLRALCERLAILTEKLEELSSEPENRDEWRRLSKTLSGGIPSDEEFVKAEKETVSLEILCAQIKELREKELSARQRELLDRFKDHVPAEKERESLNVCARRYRELLNGQNPTDSSARKRAKEHEADSDRKGRPVRTLLIFSLIMAVFGVAVLFLMPPAGFFMIGLGAASLVGCGFLYLKLQVDKAVNGQRNEEEERLHKELLNIEAKMREILVSYGYYSQMGIIYDFAAFEKDLEEYEAFCEVYDEHNAILEEKERKYRELSKSVDGFFEKYGVREQADRKSTLAGFRADVSDYQRLREQAVQSERKRDAYRKQQRECRERIEDILADHGLTIAKEPGEQAEALAGARAEYEHILQNINSMEEKAEEYKTKNNLANRPDEPEADEELSLEMLSERCNSLAALDREIADAERRLEDLPERQNQLEAEKDCLDDYRAKYEIYMAAAGFLKAAEQNLREKYIRPVRERFCNYSEALERALGEKITMDRDFRIYYERGGENRTERHLSAGQRCICQLCFRLALMDEMFGEEKPFLIMDDPFTGLDGVHMEKTAKLLGELAGGRQIIYFCCHDSRKVM